MMKIIKALAISMLAAFGALCIIVGITSAHNNGASTTTASPQQEIAADDPPADPPYDCQQAWKPPIADRPEITCVSLTDDLLMSLRNATKAKVQKAMGAKGLPRNNHGAEALHYASPQDHLGGDATFMFGPDGHVVSIIGSAQNNDGNKVGPSLEFA